MAGDWGGSAPLSSPCAGLWMGASSAQCGGVPGACGWLAFLTGAVNRSSGCSWDKGYLRGSPVVRVSHPRPALSVLASGGRRLRSPLLRVRNLPTAGGGVRSGLPPQYLPSFGWSLFGGAWGSHAIRHGAKVPGSAIHTTPQPQSAYHTLRVCSKYIGGFS